MIEDQHQRKETTKEIYYILHLYFAVRKIEKPLKRKNDKIGLQR